jgi:hypothetical protein
MSWEERGGAAAGVPGWARGEARLALRAMSAAHCPGVKVPFHSAPAPVDGITPSRSSPSRYVPRSEDGARSKLRLLSYLCQNGHTSGAFFPFAGSASPSRFGDGALFARVRAATKDNISERRTGIKEK